MGKVTMHHESVGWPSGMNRAVGTEYAGVRAGHFDKLVADGRMPAPRREGSWLVWLHDDTRLPCERFRPRIGYPYASWLRRAIWKSLINRYKSSLSGRARATMGICADRNSAPPLLVDVVPPILRQPASLPLKPSRPSNSCGVGAGRRTLAAPHWRSVAVVPLPETTLLSAVTMNAVYSARSMSVLFPKTASASVSCGCPVPECVIVEESIATPIGGGMRDPGKETWPDAETLSPL